MKLLLTNELLAMAGRSVEELSIAFIPTAANVEEGDKSWLIDDLVRFKNLKPEIINKLYLLTIDFNWF